MTPSADLPGFGKPLQMTPRDLEMTAATTNMMAKLGITSDSLEKPFSQTDLDATWKYKSSSSNPSLKMLSNLRMGEGETTGADEKWTNFFNQLVDSLPPNIKRAYAQQLSLPSEERSQNFSAMQDALEMAASTLAWLDTASSVDENSSDNVKLTAANEGLVNLAKFTVSVQGSEMLNALDALLQNIGHNDPNFDGLSNVTNQTKELMQGFQSLVSQGNAATKEEWAQLAESLGKLSVQFQTVSLGDKLQSLGPLLATMALIADAGSLKTGAASLMLGLGIGLIGIDSSPNQGGMLSPSVRAALHSLAETLSSTVMPNGGNGRFLEQLLTVGLMGIASLDSLTKSERSGFTLELALSLLVGSGLLDTVSSGIAKAGGANERSLPQASALLSAISLLFLTHVIGKDNSNVGVTIAESLHATYADLLDEVGEFLTTQRAKGNITSSEASKVDIAIQKGRIALGQEDYDGLLAATMDIEHAFDAGSTKTDQAWKSQQESLKQFMDVLIVAETLMHKESGSRTAIVQA
jgi:hypothetical protein